MATGFKCGLTMIAMAERLSTPRSTSGVAASSLKPDDSTVCWTTDLAFHTGLRSLQFQAKFREAAKSFEHLKEGLAKARRSAGMDGSVPAAAAAGSALAARSALAASNAAAAAAALEAVQKKV